MDIRSLATIRWHLSAARSCSCRSRSPRCCPYLVAYVGWVLLTFPAYLLATIRGHRRVAGRPGCLALALIRALISELRGGPERIY